MKSHRTCVISPGTSFAISCEVLSSGKLFRKPEPTVFSRWSCKRPLTVVVAVQSLSPFQLCDFMDCSTPGSSVCCISQSLLKFMSFESVILSDHLILCFPLLFLPSIFPSIRVFSNELALRIRLPKYWSFRFSISPSKDYSGIDFQTPGGKKTQMFRINHIVCPNCLDTISHAAAAAKSLQSCPTLRNPIDSSPPGSPVPGILQARTLEWVSISFSNAWKGKWKWSHSVMSNS